LGWHTLRGPGLPCLPLALSIDVYQAPLFKTDLVHHGSRWGLLGTLRKFVIIFELKGGAVRGTAKAYANLYDGKARNIVGRIHSYTQTLCSYQINANIEDQAVSCQVMRF
jgi:hypothetical protein